MTPGEVLGRRVPGGLGDTRRQPDRRPQGDGHHHRVKQAETEFAAARKGMSDQTPLRQAAQQFNAAAVALEMSWLALLAAIRVLCLLA